MTDIEDPIADTIVEDSSETQLYRSSWLDQTVSKKLGYIAALLASFMLAIPLVLTAPEGAFDEGFSSSTPEGMIVALIGIGTLVVCGVAMIGLQLARRRMELTGDQRYSTYILEDMASMLAFVPGAGLLVIAELMMIVLHQGENVFRRDASLLGSDPTLQAGLSMSVPTVAVLALVCAAAVYSLSQYSAYVDD